MDITTDAFQLLAGTTTLRAPDIEPGAGMVVAG